MHETGNALRELDLALINALQIAPRAPWRLIGEVLEVNPVTAARHWERLSTEGLAWVTAYGAPSLMRSMSFALVAVHCTADRVHDVAAALADDPQAVTIAHTVGTCDLLVTVWTPDLPTLSHYLLRRLNTLPGVVSSRTSVANEMFVEGSHWRLGSLSPAQRRRLQGGSPSRTRVAELRPEDRRLAVALSRDGRASYEELATATGASPSTVRRRLYRLLDSGALTLRCEVSRSFSGRPVSATLWIDVPHHALADAAAHLAGLPQTRMCAAVVGHSDLALTVWLRSVEELQPLEMEIAAAVPNLVVAERTLTLRHVKLMGRVLRDDGRAARAVPLDIWRHPVPPTLESRLTLHQR
ncbi:AsnC family transcriptional regulator [Actinoallomurus oryzae]|uniref:AsnC family transcriptional regulator n=1 Tax=Actinoallomurus oryzae TaxID=502180 RepID=A0ABP8Q9H9_9ACTN